MVSWSLSGLATLIWVIFVVVGDLGPRVIENWESAATMLFGSFLAGSSPEGGGAVAFPIFTKALEVPGPVARTFGLCIQAVGMSMAAASILLFGRPFHRRAFAVATPAAVAGFLVAVLFFGDSDHVFWSSTIGTPWVKATFSIVLATTSVLMLRHLRQGHTGQEHPGLEHSDTQDAPPGVAGEWNRRLDIGLVVVASAGGFLSSLTGTGANIMVFLFLVVLAGVGPKSALPTAIMVMAVVSVVGMALLGLIDGQLAVETTGDRVISVGGSPTDLDAGNADLLGLWLAAVPVVVWGAPLGSFCAALVRERLLVRFVAVLAATEVITTFVLVPELRTDPALIAFLIAGLIVVPAGFLLLGEHREVVFAIDRRGTPVTNDPSTMDDGAPFVG